MFLSSSNFDMQKFEKALLMSENAFILRRKTKNTFIEQFLIFTITSCRFSRQFYQITVIIWLNARFIPLSSVERCFYLQLQLHKTVTFKHNFATLKLRFFITYNRELLEKNRLSNMKVLDHVCKFLEKREFQTLIFDLTYVF